MHPLIGRLQQTVITIFTAVTLGFVLIHQLPSGPWQIIQARYSQEQLAEMDPEQIRQISERLMGFSANEPILVRYVEFWQNALSLDFGTSVMFSQPVFSVLAPAIPWTVLISSLAMVANVSIGVTLGAYMAYREGSRFDVGGTFVSVLLTSIPYYVLAILLLFFVGYQTPLFPDGGRYAQELTVGFNLDFMLSALHHAALPALSLVFTSFAALGLRAHSIRILGSDYIRVARLRGLSERRIVLHYVLRNSILPYYTGFVVGLVGLLGGSIITEQIFQYTGIGYYLFQAAVGGDIPMVLGTFFLFTIATVLMLLFVDLTYGFVDPRAEGVGTSESF
jgi:peptide/nickel transport system permease protein